MLLLVLMAVVSVRVMVFVIVLMLSMVLEVTVMKITLAPPTLLFLCRTQQSEISITRK